MKRLILAAACGAAAAGACAPAGPPPVVRVRLPDEEPAVRVGIAVDTAAVAVGSAGRFTIEEVGGRTAVRTGAGETWSFTADGAGRLIATGPGGRRLGPFGAPVRIRARGGEPVRIGGASYRGDALIRATGPGRVTAVNVLALEDYLLGVVPLEIGARPAEEVEAVKAQAVAARTYAVSHLGGRASLGFDFYATVADQAYGGVAREDPVVGRAVRETRGEVLTHDGLPVLAYYHSTCGGKTAAIDEVWPRPPLAYLKSVSDRVRGGDGRYYCETSNRFRWTERWSGEALRETLSRTLAGRPGVGGRIGRVEAIEVTGRTASGRAEALRIVVDGRTHVVRGDSIRWILRPEPGRILNSTLFVLDAERRGGEVTRLEAHGGGWGHGIGMCQMGAIGRARHGQKYREILRTYYRGTEVVRLY